MSVNWFVRARLAPFALLACALVPLAAFPRAAAQSDRCFLETDLCISGRIRAYWEHNGGLSVFGFPLTPLRAEDVEGSPTPVQAQWFERAHLELHPEHAAPYDVLLGRLGIDALLQAGVDWQSQPRESGPHAGCLWFAQTGHNVCDQGHRSGFKTYWQTHGLQLDRRRTMSYDESLALFGLPLTAPHLETNSSGESVLTQWFERARFEWHPDQPDVYQVLLGLLGSEIVSASTPPISDLTAVNGTLFFLVSTGQTGLELWKSDGTAVGTALVKDINPGPGDAFDPTSDVHGLANVDGTLFFAAQDGSHGYELWKSDGSTTGTVMVKDIDTELGGSYPAFLTNVNGTVFFVAVNRATGRELWKSDGTAAGTALVKDIRTIGVGSAPTNLTNVNGTLFFFADAEPTGRELWKSDGTEAGTALVKDIVPGRESVSADLLTNVSGTLFFRARTNDTGVELWKSDGTDAGTVLVKDIQPGPTDSLPERLLAIGTTLFFDAVGQTIGLEVWKSDGTAQGTVPVRDINPGLGRAGPDWLTGSNGALFFAAEDGSSGRELWTSDGTAAGTVLVKDIVPGPGGAGPDWLTDVNGTLFFFADDGQHGRELWKSDGTAAGTVLVSDITAGPAGTNHRVLANLRGTLFFAVDAGVRGKALWKSDGTAAGTVLVKNTGLGRFGP